MESACTLKKFETECKKIENTVSKDYPISIT